MIWFSRPLEKPFEEKKKGPEISKNYEVSGNAFRKMNSNKSPMNISRLVRQRLDLQDLRIRQGFTVCQWIPSCRKGFKDSASFLALLGELLQDLVANSIVYVPSLSHRTLPDSCCDLCCTGSCNLLAAIRWCPCRWRRKEQNPRLHPRQCIVINIIFTTYLSNFWSININEVIKCRSRALVNAKGRRIPPAL